MSIDVVYTWVNHKDLEWQQKYRKALRDEVVPADAHKSIYDIARFQNRNELYYSIKSVRKYAPWVDKIFVVTNCKLPEWAEFDSGIFSITHEEIFLDTKVLPTFNSHAIEANLHHISGLSERFLYFNDDVFLCRPVSTTDFFPSSEKVNLFPSKHNIIYDEEEISLPVDYAALNACKIIIKDFQFKPEKKLHHAPFPLLKSMLMEIERTYNTALTITNNHKFRSKEDLPLATTLHAYYCLAKGVGEMKDIPARYIDIGDPLFVFLVLPFSPLLRRKYITLCLNEVSGIGPFTIFRDMVVKGLLDRMFVKDDR